MVRVGCRCALIDAQEGLVEETCGLWAAGENLDRARARDCNQDRLSNYMDGSWKSCGEIVHECRLQLISSLFMAAPDDLDTFGPPLEAGSRSVGNQIRVLFSCPSIVCVFRLGSQWSPYLHHPVASLDYVKWSRAIFL